MHFLSDVMVLSTLYLPTPLCKHTYNPQFPTLYQGCPIGSPLVQNQEINQIREWIPHIGPLTKVIPLKVAYYSFSETS